MKTQIKTQKKLHYIGIWILTASLFLGFNTVFANPVLLNVEPVSINNPDGVNDQINKIYSTKQKDKSLIIQNDKFGDAIFIKLFEKKIGNFLSLTQIPIKCFAFRKNKNSNNPNEFIEKENNNNWNTNIELEFNMGFLNNEETLCPNQYIAVSGHINRFNIMLVLILNS